MEGRKYARLSCSKTGGPNLFLKLASIDDRVVHPMV